MALLDRFLQSEIKKNKLKESGTYLSPTSLQYTPPTQYQTMWRTKARRAVHLRRTGTAGKALGNFVSGQGADGTDNMALNYAQLYFAFSS